MVSEENDYQIISLLTESRISTQRLQLVDNRDSVVAPGLEHPGHQLPLSAERVILQDVIKVLMTAITPAA